MSFEQKKKLKLKNLKIKQTELQPIFSVKTFFKAYLSALKSRALFFNYPFSASKTTSNIFKYLEKNRRIAGYKIFPQNKNVKIFLSYDFTQNKTWIPKVIYYSSQGRIRSASFKHLQQFQLQNPNSLTLIGTSFGIMDLESCLFHKCGGEFLVSLT